MRMTSHAAEAMLAALKSELDGGFLYFFAGPVPDGPDDALDMDNDHTQVAMLTESADGVTGLTFAAPVDHTITKDPLEDWRAVVAFDGADDGETSLTPTFFRFCTSSDDGRGAATAPRLQGTIGGPNSTADVRLSTDSLTANGVNETGLAGFTISLASLG